jgi:hypothetical protein
MTLIAPNVAITTQDTVSVDAFGRWRSSNPHSIFDSKQIHDNGPLFWDESLESGVGISSAHSVNTASTVITSTNLTAGVFTRQTFMRFNYQPGKSQQILLTGIIERSGGGTGVERRIGLFDDDNGLFFESNAGTVGVTRRTNVTGSPIDNTVVQSSWNVDLMDGSGGTANPSGLTVDWTKTQIFGMDFEWLGVGRVRMFLGIAGKLYPVHEFLNANVLDKVYMSTPNLPLRYQMVTTGSSPVTTMEAICCTVESEGGVDDLGALRSAGTEGAHVDCNTENVIYAIVGIRLKTGYIGATINIERIALQIQTQSETGEWIWILNPVVGGTFTYGDETSSAVQIARGVTANTVTGGTRITGGFGESTSSGGGSGGVSSPIPNALRLGCKIDGTVDEMVLCWMPNGGSTNHDIEGSITWRELS